MNTLDIVGLVVIVVLLLLAFAGFAERWLPMRWRVWLRREEEHVRTESELRCLRRKSRRKARGDAAERYWRRFWFGHD